MGDTGPLARVKNAEAFGNAHAAAVRIGDADPSAAEAAGLQLTTLVKNTIGVTVGTVVQDPGTIERSMGKMRRIIDERPH